MIFDSHMHSKFSTDSNMKITDAISTAKEKNLGIIITDHMDLDYPSLNEFKFHVPSYFKEYENYRCHSLCLGIEIGLAESTLIENEQLTSSYNFDFVLGSIHNVNNMDIYLDYVKTNYSKRELIQYYLENMLNCIKLYNNFDSLSHIDYLCRYTSFENNEIDVTLYKDILSEIFKTLLSKNKVIELNTARLNNKTSRDSLLEIYKLYKDLGGKYVTLGSDAHTLNSIGRNFNVAQDMISILNLKGVYFKDRNIQLF
ncbi:histidinol phosphate phosphatase [Clostridium carnis]